jgi:hypothetical protein
MVVETTAHGQRVAQLHALLERWTAEYPAVLAVDAERARHHLEGIGDLQSLIAQFQARERAGVGARAVPDETCAGRASRVSRPRRDHGSRRPTPVAHP